jgi:hypothetical protein
MDDSRLERMERRVDELDQRAGAMERAIDTAMRQSRAAMDTIVPDEARRHMRAAWRENLLAVRSMIDHWADRLADDKGGDKSAAAQDSAADRDTGRENIPID